MFSGFQNLRFVYVWFSSLQSKLFEGLEEDSGLSPDTFVPRKNIKKLVLKPKSGREVRTRSLMLQSAWLWTTTL